MRRAPADLKEIGLDAFLRPFLDVIRSEVTTGPITGVALNSVRKFITYGLIGALVAERVPFSRRPIFPLQNGRPRWKLMPAAHPFSPDTKGEEGMRAIETLADAVTRAKFVGTDLAGDEVVLMRILDVLRGLLLSPCGNLMSNESVCEVMQVRAGRSIAHNQPTCRRDVTHA